MHSTILGSVVGCMSKESREPSCVRGQKMVLQQGVAPCSVQFIIPASLSFRRETHMMRLLGKLVLISLISLTAAAANAGSFAPAPRVVVALERDFLNGSGSQSLGELLDTGILRYLLTGGQALAVLVNGTPYSSTAGDLDALPLAAMERIELLGRREPRHVWRQYRSQRPQRRAQAGLERRGGARAHATAEPQGAAKVIRATPRGAEKSARGT